MNPKTKEHWDKVYQTKSAEEVSWFQDTPTTSMELINKFSTSKDCALIDVGGGASCLIDHLLLNGFKNTTVLDISDHGLNHSKKRLGEKKNQVQWIVQDIRDLNNKGKYDLWHDRALFHFLNSTEEKQTYLKTLKSSLTKNGVAIIYTFSEEGPLKCSGLLTSRYDQETMVELFKPFFECIHFQKETHLTPTNKQQLFNIWAFKLT